MSEFTQYVEKLTSTPITWVRSAESKFRFRANPDGREVVLKLNDFPDEPICTLIIENSKADLEHFPDIWKLPSKEMDSSERI